MSDMVYDRRKLPDEHYYEVWVVLPNSACEDYQPRVNFEHNLAFGIQIDGWSLRKPKILKTETKCITCNHVTYVSGDSIISDIPFFLGLCVNCVQS